MGIYKIVRRRAGSSEETIARMLTIEEAYALCKANGWLDDEDTYIEASVPRELEIRLNKILKRTPSAELDYLLEAVVYSRDEAEYKRALTVLEAAVKKYEEGDSRV